jgi:hypothetical protein
VRAAAELMRQDIAGKMAQHELQKLSNYEFIECLQKKRF